MALHSRREREAIMREIRLRRDPAGQAFVREVRLPSEVPDDAIGHAASVPAATALRGGLTLDPRVTFLVGENGAGKSTVAEAIAVAMGMNAEGGGRHLRHATRESHAPLGEHLRVTRGARTPRSDFFLRAESVFTLATHLEELAAEDERALAPYGDVPLHERSHGESFLALAEHRLGPDGFYVLDEPESALSPRNVLALARRIVALADAGSQFVIATHSPLLLAVPGARIVLCDEDGLRPIDREDAPSVVMTRRFLAAPATYLRALLEDPAPDGGDRGAAENATADEGVGADGDASGAAAGGATGREDDPGPGGGFVRELCLDPRKVDGDPGPAPGIAAAVRTGIRLHPAVTFLTGENGAGKSTLAEAVAVAIGINPEGGGSNWWFTTRASHSGLGERLLVVRGRRERPLNRFFLRAESVFTMATAIEQGANTGEGGLEAYGDVSLHEQSHGESFLALVLHRLGPNGFFVLDEPEAPLSPQGQLALLHRIHELVLAGGQFVIATHSPILLAYPHASILRCDEAGVSPIGYDEAGTVVLTRRMLDAPGIDAPAD